MNEPVNPLYSNIRKLLIYARHTAVCNVNTLQVLTNFEIGRLIVEHEQKGAQRAKYGEQILKELSKRLTSEFGRGFSWRNLNHKRRFYLEYNDRVQQYTDSRLLPGNLPNILQTPSAKSYAPFPLSWSHYVFLMGINNQNERNFYEIESISGNWSLRELKRQNSSGLYERLALSRDKEKVKELSARGQLIEKPEDILKNPYVLEFLGLDEKSAYSENDLETAIINKIEHFLLELGKGFLFEARQKRFTFDEDHFFVDLVFYNRLLRCYVLIDLKIGKLTHQDLGQMQMYVNYFDRYVKLEDENPTIGILLCKQKSDALVELTLPEKSNIYASQYQLYLPSKEVLRQKLIEWTLE
ncbi:MAG: PDDEXK nuclease domain-containing protein [Pseudomonadota bacterium]